MRLSKENAKSTLFLDFDNTLFPSKELGTGALQAVFTHLEKNGYGSSNQLRVLYESIKKKRKKILKHSTSNRLRILFFKEMLESIQGSFTKRDSAYLLELEKVYYKSFQTQIKEFKEANLIFYRKVFRKLRQISKKHSILIVSNENLRTQLHKYSAFFPKNLQIPILCSEEIGVEKPTKNFFQKALEISNAIPKNTLMIGDSLEDDIKGAKQFKIACVHQTGIIDSNPEEKVLPKKDLWISKNLFDSLLFFESGAWKKK